MTRDEEWRALRALRALRAKLIEDVDSEAEADRLLPTARRLADWSAPVPSARDTAALLQTLSASLPHRRPPALIKMGWLLRAQMRVVQQEIWLASTLVMTLGVVITLASANQTTEMLPLVLVAPLVAALGIVFLYGPAADPSLEIELATPISPRLIVLMRLLLVFAFDLGLGLTGSVILVMVHSEWSLWPLIALWLAPMTCLTALAFLLSVLSIDVLISASLCLVLWGMQFVRLLEPFSTWPNWLANEAQPWLWVGTVVFGSVAVWLADRQERWLLKRM